MALVNQGVMTSFHHVNFFLMTIQGDELEIHSNLVIYTSFGFRLSFLVFAVQKVIFTHIYSGSLKMLMIENHADLSSKMIKTHKHF